MPKLIWIPALLAAVVVAGAQAKGGDTLTGKTWLLRSLGLASRQSSGITATFTTGGRVSGFSGCNSYSGSYTTSGTSISIPNTLAVTMMACRPALMAQEGAYLRTLTTATSFSVRNGVLTLVGRRSRTVARFTVQSQSLAWTSWLVTGYNNGKEAVVSVTTGTKLTATFGTADVSGSAGCNEYHGAVKVSPPRITIGPLASTRKACATPEGVMTQEQQFLAALESAATYRLQGATLELRTAGGAIVVTLHRV